MLKPFACGVLLLILFRSDVVAQEPRNHSSTDGITPASMSADFDGVNYFSGKLNFALPLLKIGGRGSAGYTMMLRIDNPWRVIHNAFPSNCGQTGCQGVTNQYRPLNGYWSTIRPGFGPGVLLARHSGVRTSGFGLLLSFCRFRQSGRYHAQFRCNAKAG